MKHLIIVIFLMLLGMVVFAEETDPPISPELEAHLEELEAFVSNARELEPQFPVTRRFVSAEEARQVMATYYEEELAKAYTQYYGLFYRALGFVSADFDLASFYGNFVADNISGYYAAYEQELFIVLSDEDIADNQLHPYRQMIYVHEFTHALQDQHFNLAYRNMQTSKSPDTGLASSALIEGDANYIMREFLLYLRRNNSRAFNAVNEAMAEQQIDGADDSPPIFMAEFVFMYSESLNFIRHLWANGGWERVNEAFRDYELVTAHILFPQKYLAGHYPSEVTLPDMLPILGDGWQFAENRAVGAFHLREYLAQHMPATTASDRLSSWNGDSIGLYYHPEDDTVAWLLGIAWDVAEGAYQFGDNYVPLFLQEAFPHWDNTHKCGISDVQTVCYIIVNELSYIASAPDKDTAIAMIAKITEGILP